MAAADIDVTKLPGYVPGKMHADKKAMQAASLNLQGRDWCAHTLIDLNNCRRASLSMPWKCGHERHVYEMCMYQDWLRQKRNQTLKAKAIEEAAAKKS